LIGGGEGKGEEERAQQTKAQKELLLLYQFYSKDF